MNAVARRSALLLASLRELDARTDALDPRACEVEDAAAADALAVAMLDHLRRALDLMQQLRYEGALAGAAVEGGPGDGAVGAGDGAGAGAAGDGAGDGLDDGPPDPVGDVCFAGSFELNRVMRELAAARGPGERLIATETARRKLRRAVRAVLGAARDDDGPRDEPPAADLVAGLAVRRLYAGLRRGLRRAEDDSPEAVLVAVRYAAGALAVMVTAAAYVDVRVSDRAILRKLRERALTWARHDRSVREGQFLLEDVWTFADLLRDINRRQELRDHDASLVQALLDAPDDTPAWFARLEGLYGLDDALDRLIDRARDAPALGALLPDVLARLARV